MRMSILLYDGFTTLDIVGGYESLARIPNMQTEFVAKEVGIYAADTRWVSMPGRHSKTQKALTSYTCRGAWAFTPRNATRRSSTSSVSRMKRRLGP